MTSLREFQLNYETGLDPGLQTALESADAQLRRPIGMEPTQTAVGVLDLLHLRLALIHPDRMEYAASLAKVGILLAYFDLRPEPGAPLDRSTQHELGLMIKASSNEMATQFSRALGLQRIQQTLNGLGFYNVARGGGLWMGKHYGVQGERLGDPLHDFSHGTTVRQMLRFYLLLEQGRLVSPQASRIMQAIFDSPETPHDTLSFAAGLTGRNLQLRRKWGEWEDWHHDSAVVRGPGRHYILVGLTHHPDGERYLVELARQVDDLMVRYSGHESGSTAPLSP
jgi:beta-lactamase class A